MNNNNIMMCLMLALVGTQLGAYNQECWDAMPGEEVHIPFGGQLVDYTITMPSDIMVVGHGRVNRYCAVQLSKKERHQLHEIFDSYPDETRITTELIKDVRLKYPIMAQMLEDFHNANKQATIGTVHKALRVIK